MRILLVHNETDGGGGENELFAAEGRLLESYGHSVDRYTIPADEVDKLGRISLARKIHIPKCAAWVCFSRSSNCMASRAGASGSAGG